MKGLRGMDFEKKRFTYSLVFPLLVVLAMVLLRLMEEGFAWDLSWLGVYPRRVHGLLGILGSPLVHAGWNHLLDNAVSLLLLSTGLFYFYRDLAPRVFLILWFLTGFLVWIGARPAYHIGASGLIYGIASFLFFSGIIRRHVPLMALSLTVVFLYGSMVWGLFPLKEEISWESHLLGAAAGWILAMLYRNQGPQRPPASWELEEEEFDEEYWNQVLDEKLETKKRKSLRDELGENS